VSIGVILLIVLAANLVAVAALLWLRRGNPRGLIDESSHPGAILQVAGTLYAVMVGFVFLIAFQTYNSARSAAQEEATATETLANTAALLPAQVRDELSGDLVCYARSVIELEWPRMAEQGKLSPTTEVWLVHAARDFAGIRPRSLVDGAAGQQWLTSGADRQLARENRLKEADRLVPRVVWVLLLLGGAAVIVFVLFLSAGRNRLAARVMMVLVTSTLIAASLLTIAFLDKTYGDHRGAIEPTAMRNSLETIERERERQAAGGVAPALACDASGAPTGDAGAEGEQS
jgi:hypothetical protein